MKKQLLSLMLALSFAPILFAVNPGENIRIDSAMENNFRRMTQLEMLQRDLLEEQQLGHTVAAELERVRAQIRILRSEREHHRKKIHEIENAHRQR